MSLFPLPSALFATPTAESESRLEDVFIPTPFVDLCLANESTLVYGAPGTGKTALRLMVQRAAPPQILVVPWTPEPVPDVSLGTPLAQAAIRQAILSLVERMVQSGEICQRLQTAPAWTGLALAWFMREYLPLDPVFYIQSQCAHFPAEQTQWYLDLLQKPPASIFKPDSTQNDQLRMLMNLLQQAGFQTVWWMGDGLERWSSQSGQAIVTLIEAMLSTLAIFDVPRYLFKFFVPDTFQNVLDVTSAAARDRLKTYQLHWDTDGLVALLEKRLQTGFARSGMHLTDLCSEPAFFEWLETYGGKNPRAWLSLLRPFVERFESAPTPVPLTDWRLIARQHPPRLRLVTERQEIWLGEHPISIDSVDGFQILKFLYQRPRQICSLDELYYCGLRGLEKPPRLYDPAWEPKARWRPALDTAIYRLRKRLEWEPSDPVYLVTHPRKGLELAHVVD